MNKIIFFALHLTLYTLHGFCIEPAQVLWENASRETDSEAAEGKLREIVEKCPDSQWAIEAQYTLAEYKYLKGEYGQACQEFQTLIEKYRRNKYASLAWYRKGCCLFAAGEYDEAIREFQQSISLDPWSEHVNLARTGIADAYFAKNDYSRALMEYRRISSNRSFQHYILYKMAMCYQNLRNEKEFRASKEELIKKYPLSVESGLIKCQLESGIVPQQTLLDIKGSSPTTEAVKILQETTWTIQVGSFTKEENARNLSSALIKKKYISWIQPIKIGEGFFYRVYLGKFTTEDDVKKKAEEISRKENLPTRIVELK